MWGYANSTKCIEFLDVNNKKNITVKDLSRVSIFGCLQDVTYYEEIHTFKFNYNATLLRIEDVEKTVSMIELMVLRERNTLLHVSLRE